jgi:hypothetical protein
MNVLNLVCNSCNYSNDKINLERNYAQKINELMARKCFLIRKIMHQNDSTNKYLLECSFKFFFLVKL